MSVETQSELEWLRTRQRFGVKPGLERTQRVLAALGNPEQKLKFLHVAGTNGKGSVCAFLTALLSAKHSVGTFTSPAFSGYRGRFVVADEEISEQQFARLVRVVREVSSEVTPNDPLTEFEVLTVMAILHFAEAAVDAAVWETGLGGRYDSTNVVQPLVAAITNVGMDHMDVLGHSIRAIAYDKSGIIKPGVPLVTAAVGEALDVVKREAKSKAAPISVRGVHFADIPSATRGQQRMHYRGLYRDLWDVPVGLYGRHQLANAAVALAVYELACREGGYERLSDAEIRAAMQSVRWPGRFEIFERNGNFVILDGAHNADGAKQMVQSLQRFAQEHGIPGDEWTMVLGVLADKDVRALLRIGLPFAKKVIVTAPAVARAKKPEDLANDIKGLKPDLEVEIAETVEQALAHATATSQWVCCWGSLYTVHEARQAIKEKE